MLIVFIGFQFVENHLLYPIVMSRSVRMNPLWVLLSILVGANLGGVFGSALGALAGALIAIPVGGAVQVITREVWERTKATGPDGGGTANTSAVDVDGASSEVSTASGPPEPAGVAPRP
jgi:predicted PurR-regulated permease PerM